MSNALEQFRISPDALRLLFPGEVESRGGSLPGAAFNYLFRGRFRTEIVEVNKSPIQEIGDWCKGARKLGIHPVLLHAGSDDEIEWTEGLLGLEDNGLEVICVTEADAEYDSAEEDEDLPLPLRIMLPDAAVASRYAGLAYGVRHDVWHLCADTVFWDAYGMGLAHWKTSLVDRWSSLFKQLFFGPWNEGGASTTLGKARTHKAVDGDSTLIRSIDLPFICDKYTGGKVERLGRMPGVEVTFDPAFQQGIQGVSADPPRQAPLMERLRRFLGPSPSAHLQSAAGNAPPQQVALVVTRDSARSLQRGSPIAMVTVHEQHVRLFNMVLPGVKDASGLKVEFHAFDLIPQTGGIHTEVSDRQGNVAIDATWEFRHKNDKDLDHETANRVVLKIGNRTIECVLDLGP